MTADDEGRIDPAVVAALFNEHGEQLRRFLVGVLRDSQLANDAMQTALTKMVERGHDTRAETRKAWLFRVAYHEAILLRRRQATGDNVLRKVAWTRETHDPAADEPVMRSEAIQQVRTALDELPAEQRQIVRMRIYEEKTFATIAGELQIPLGTALSRMRSALQKLKTILEDPTK